MTGLLLFAFLLGIRHATEADHVAAVATLATRSPRPAQIAGVAAVWGVGHTAALLFFGSILLAINISLPAGASRVLESAVGVMLIVLGCDVLLRVRRKKIHLHVHEHGGVRHIHAHSHQGELAHNSSDHRHDHARGLMPRALVVGGIHGLAGTAGLMLISLQALHSVAWALVYLVLFGLGSILGMVGVSLVISLPLGFSASRVTWFSGRLEGALGLAAIFFGCWIAVQAALYGNMS